MTHPGKVVQLTDWLPPDFSAVSQYALLIAEQQAAAGAEVTVLGLNVTPPGPSTRRIGLGTLSIVPVRRQPFSRKSSWLKRIVWTFATNALLIKSAWRHLAQCD